MEKITSVTSLTSVELLVNKFKGLRGMEYSAELLILPIEDKLEILKFLKPHIVFNKKNSDLKGQIKFISYDPNSILFRDILWKIETLNKQLLYMYFKNKYSGDNIKDIILGEDNIDIFTNDGVLTYGYEDLSIDELILLNKGGEHGLGELNEVEKTLGLVKKSIDSI